MSKSQYAKTMAALSARIFGEVSTETTPRSMRVVKMFAEKPLAKRFEVTEYYPKYYQIDGFFKALRKHNLYRDEHLDFLDKKKQEKAARGIEKPKKGQGKRALKRAAKS